MVLGMEFSLVGSHANLIDILMVHEMYRDRIKNTDE